MPQDRFPDLKDLLRGVPAREVQPPVIPRPQVLPFNQLSWENFERLCTRLVASDGEVEDCHRYGVRGDFQAGIDILAHRRTDGGGIERWCYQCKRWKKMTPGELRKIVDKFSFPADQYVVLVSFEAGADLRDVVADLPEVDLWDAEDISGQLKGQPELVEDFFGLAWKDAFCPPNCQTIKQHLGLDRPPTAILKEIETVLDAAPRGPMFEPGGLCSGYPLHPMPDRYFVAHQLGLHHNDLYQALTVALAEFDVQPICTDDLFWPGHVLCKISALIQSTPFGVYQLAVNRDRNVYLELGVAMSLGRPFVLVKDRGAELSPLTRGLDCYPIDSYIEMRYKLGHKMRSFLTNIANYRPKALPSAGSEHAVVIVHNNLDAIDFCVPVAKMIAGYGLTPILLDDPQGKLAHYLELENVPHWIISGTGQARIDETVAAIQAAHFGVYRIEETGAPDAFLALGISIGLNCPRLLIHRAGADLPSNVEGLNTLKFSSYSGLEQSLSRQLDYMSSQLT